VRDEFLKRRHHVDRESVAGVYEQETQAGFPVSWAPPGSIKRGYGEAIVITFSSTIF